MRDEDGDSRRSIKIHDRLLTLPRAGVDAPRRTVGMRLRLIRFR